MKFLDYVNEWIKFDTCPYCTDTEMKSGRIQVKGHGLETSTKIRPVECG